jgi:hypothetical protein
MNRIRFINHRLLPKPNARAKATATAPRVKPKARLTIESAIPIALKPSASTRQPAERLLSDLLDKAKKEANEPNPLYQPPSTTTTSSPSAFLALSNKSLNSLSAGWRPPKPNARAKATATAPRDQPPSTTTTSSPSAGSSSATTSSSTSTVAPTTTT